MNTEFIFVMTNNRPKRRKNERKRGESLPQMKFERNCNAWGVFLYHIPTVPAHQLQMLLDINLIM